MRCRIGVTALLLLIIAPAIARCADHWGSLTGTFIYDGTAPVPRKLEITKDQECCGQYQEEIVDQSLLVGPEGGLSNVVVILKKTPKIAIHPDLKSHAAENPAVIDNVHCMFYPHVIGVWAGEQTLVIKNSDPIGQAAKLDTLKNPPINTLLPVGAKIEQKFQKAETLPALLTCGIHPWEGGLVVVQDHPYFAVTDMSGKFQMDKIPVGEWEFRFWHEKVGYLNAKPDWKKGTTKIKIAEGTNDMGTLKLATKLFEKKK